MTESLPSTEENFVPGLTHKTDHSARPKIPSYPQTRRPAGGLSRPLPSPGKICFFIYTTYEKCWSNHTLVSGR